MQVDVNWWWGWIREVTIVHSGTLLFKTELVSDSMLVVEKRFMPQSAREFTTLQQIFLQGYA